MHVNDLLIPESYVRSGLEVEFETEEGGRGLKASSVRLAERSGAPAPQPVRAPLPTPSTAAATTLSASGGEDSLCDVLGVEEYTREVTELLLKAGPRLTGEQILEIRHELLKAAESHGWTED